jgi:hypothetical protein
MTYDSLKRRRDIAIDLGQFWRVFLQDRRHGFGSGVALEGALPAQHFKQDRAEGKDVGTIVDGHAANLFRRHVPGGADDLPGLGMHHFGDGEGLAGI